MMSKNLVRFFHISTTRFAAGTNKSNLAKLRKKTGYPFGNCKKALEASNNNVEKAEKWLEEQAKALGWSKAMKMESRNTLQGLVGIAWDKQYAAMVEVNCETDFVGRNEKFQKLVDLVAKTCLQHTKKGSPSASSFGKVVLDGKEIGELQAADTQTLSDHLVKGVAVVGEKLVLRRAALLTCPAPAQLSAHTHPAPTNSATGSCLLGKYGALLVYSAQTGGDKPALLAKQLCQHVIGMNPSTLEAPEGVTKAPKKEKAPPPASSEEGEEEGGPQVLAEEDDETAMMRQTFLLDPDRTVADVVAEAGIQVEDFVRFECGEGLVETEEVAAKAAQQGG